MLMNLLIYNNANSNWEKKRISLLRDERSYKNTIAEPIIFALGPATITVKLIILNSDGAHSVKV